MFHFVLLSLFPRIDIIIIIIIMIIKREWSIKTLFVAQLIRIISWRKLPADIQKIREVKRGHDDG